MSRDGYCLECNGFTCEHVKPRTPPALSPQEVRILRLVAQGWTNKAVSAALGITEGTVKVYMNQLYQKLPPAPNEVSSRAAAMLWALARPELLEA